MKLGYGGTKEEMQRLLEDAQELSGVEYDISNLNDVYEAIHVVQTELGITGTTAKEASTTIQGSAASMKSAWENLLVGMADENQNFDALLENLVNSIGTFAENLLPRIKVALGGVVKLIAALGPQITSNLLPQITDLAMSMGQTFIDGLTSKFPELTDSFSSIGEIVKSTVSLIQDIVTAFTILFENIWNTWGEDIMSFAQETFSNIITIVQNAVNLIENIVALFTAIFKGDWEGVFTAVQNIASSGWELIKSIFQGAIDAVNGIIRAGFTLMGTIVSGLMELLWTGIKNAWSSITAWFNEVIFGDEGLLAWFNSLGESFFNIGASLINWVWDGIKSVWESVVSWVQEKVDWITEKLSFWKSSQSEMSSGSVAAVVTSSSSVDGSHAGGLSYVPFDGYTALLHKGERVLTAKENAAYSSTANNSSTINYTAGNIIIQGNADTLTVDKIRGMLQQEYNNFSTQLNQYAQTHKA